MSADCPFCAIVAGEIPARTVHEDETAMGFLDANPLAPGHTLVIPKDHHERVGDLPAGLAENVLTTLYDLAPAVEAAVEADGTTIAFNDGEAAGQEVPHVHGHVVPRFDDDGGRPIHALFDSRPDLAEEELDRIAGDVVERVSDR
ncbi:MAG: HIT family protein [Halobacteriaceae archaeon]